MFGWFRGDDFPGLLDTKTVPEPLKAVIGKGECVLFAGEELSRPCGMPVWSIFVLGFADWLLTARLLSPEDSAQIHLLHRDNKVGAIMARLKRATESDPSLIVRYAEDLYLKPAGLSRIHDALRNIPLCGALTPNLDELLEMMLRLPPEAALTPEDSEDASARLAAATPVFMKLRGTLARPDSVSVWIDDAVGKASAAPGFSQFFAELMNTRTLLMVGVTVWDVETWMGAARINARPQRKHWALIPAEPNITDRAKALHKKYNIQLVHHPPKDTVLTVAFLQNLVGQAEAVTAMDD